MDSKFLDNTSKDLIGAISAVVFLAVLLEVDPSESELDRKVTSQMSKESEAIGKLVDAVLSVALAQNLKQEVSGTLSDLVTSQPGYYDRMTVNTLLTFYARGKKMRDFFAGCRAEFHGTCIGILRTRLLMLASATFWCRVYAYERGVPETALSLAQIHSASLALVPIRFRSEFESCETWATLAKSHWRESEETQRALLRTGGVDLGLTKVLSQF